MKKLIFALIAGAAAVGAAHAQGPYVGVGIAWAKHEFSVAGASNADTEGYKASPKLFAGYDIDGMFGAEAGYINFRDADATFTLGGMAGRAETEGRAMYLAGKATAPMNQQFSVFGKLGLAYSKSKLRSATPGLTRDDSDTGVYAGVGAQYNLNKQVALSVEYERYGQSRDFGVKPDVWTVAARYTF